MGTILISTVYSIEPVMACINHFSPSKIILISEKDAPKEKLDVENILKETIGKVIELETVKTELYDILKAAKDIADVIDEESELGNSIIVNVSGSRKTQALGALFGCYARASSVDNVVYVVQETHDVIELPIISYGISNTKKKLLYILNEAGGTCSVKDLSDKLNISRGMVYHHINDLRDYGLIDKNEISISFAGKLAII